jgi:hypothetical protein
MANYHVDILLTFKNCNDTISSKAMDRRDAVIHVKTTTKSPVAGCPLGLGLFNCPWFMLCNMEKILVVIIRSPLYEAISHANEGRLIPFDSPLNVSRLLVCGHTTQGLFWCNCLSAQIAICLSCFVEHLCRVQSI